jgi:phosphatidylinositol alpha-1,6-mannosyltransferase
MQSNNIIISTQNFPPAAGGIQNYMYELALALHNLGQTVRVICDAPTEKNQAQFDATLPFAIERVGGPKILRRYLKAKRIQKLLKAPNDLLLICDSWKSLELVAANNNTVTACIAHGMEFPEQSSAKKRHRIAKTLSRAQLVLANSLFTADRLRPYLTQSDTLQILHPGVNPPCQATAKDIETVAAWAGAHHPVLVTVGRLEERKGQDKIINILPRLLADFPNLIYMIAGSGPLKEQLSRQAIALGVENKLQFCGRVSDGERAALLSKATLFAMPCRIEGKSVEGFGIVYLEAAMFGVPSLAGQAGGAGDAVIDGETGLLCNGDDENDVYHSIKKMLNDPNSLKDMGTKAQHRAENEFQWGQIALQLLSYTAAK